jgi:hypothetical protein
MEEPAPMVTRAWFRSSLREHHEGSQLAAPIEVPTLPKVLLALLPRVVMAAMQTTIIRASITAYSTAVGPSS